MEFTQLPAASPFTGMRGPGPGPGNRDFNYPLCAGFNWCRRADFTLSVHRSIGYLPQPAPPGVCKLQMTGGAGLSLRPSLSTEPALRRLLCKRRHAKPCRYGVTLPGLPPILRLAWRTHAWQAVLAPCCLRSLGARQAQQHRRQAAARLPLKLPDSVKRN